MRSLVTASGVVGVVFGVLAATGCSGMDPEGPATGPDTEKPVESGGLAAPPSGKGVQFTMQRQIPPGTEAHFCKHFVVPEGGIDAAKLEHEASENTHHILVYRTSLTAADIDDSTFDCGDIPGALVYSSQALAEASNYPEGVGMRIAGGEVIRVESHFLNITGDPLTPEVRFNLWRAEAPLQMEAGSLFMYDRDIAVPAHGSFTTRMHCEIPADIEISFLMPHTHLLGTAERIFISGPGLDAPLSIVTSKGYDDLHTRVFPDTIKVKAGQAIDFECDYQNNSDKDVVEGPSRTDNEMCMILGGYYPRMDTAAEWCTRPGSGARHEGKKTCGEALGCAQSTAQSGGTALAAEQCFIDVCPGSSRAINDLINCSVNNCTGKCPGPDCQACSSSKCGAEFLSCQAATCSP
jgi:hypothetical protein